MSKGVGPRMFSPLLVIFFFSGFVSAGLSFSIAYLMLVSFRAVRSAYLVGFPIGFTLLGMSYLFSGTQYVLSLPENLSNWLNLLLGLSGFTFLAITYFLKKKSVKWRFIGTFPFLALLTLFVVAVGVVFAYDFPTSWYQSVELEFHVLNLGLLGYVIYSLSQALRNEVELSSVVLGFTFLAIEQYSLLLWSLDRSFTWSFVFAQFIRLAGLVIFVIFIMKGFRHA